MRVAGVLGDGDRSAAGVGVGGSSSVSQLSWLLRLAAASEQANLTRRPPRPRRCHTEHSTTATLKNHKTQKLKRISAGEIHCWLWLKVSFQQNYIACDRHDLSSEMSRYHLENVKQLKTHLGWEASLRICPGGNRC